MFTKSKIENKRKISLNELLKENEERPIYIEAKKVAADDDMNVLITGESGTGKELLAEYIHINSPRVNNPFIPVNMASLPDSLIDSVLFGHTKGAFTGATKDKDGFFKKADGGTIFLDEIGDISYRTQVALLRVLDYGEIIKVGKNEPEEVNVRIIAATNADLQNKISEKSFRDDLYYRLSGVELFLEPFRTLTHQQRKASLEKLISNTAIHKNKNVKELTVSAWDLLLDYEFKGNYREARNIIERMYLEDNLIMDAQDINKIISSRNSVSQQYEDKKNIKLKTSNKYLKLNEQVAIIVHETLTKHKGVKKSAYEELGIDFKTLQKHLSIYNSLGIVPVPIG